MLSIYALIDPQTQLIRYVGITKLSLEQRLHAHLKDARQGKPFPVHKWIRKLLSQQLHPAIQLLEADLFPDREAYWIAHYRSIGMSLLNCTDGGDGLRSPSEATRKLLSEKTRLNWQSADLRQRMMASRLPMPCTDDTRQKLSLANRGRKHTERTKQNMRRPKSPEHRLKAMLGRRLALSEGRGVATGDANGLRLHPESILRGAQNPLAKLTDEAVVTMRALYDAKVMGTPRLAKRFGVSQCTTWRIVKRLSWRHLP